VVPPFGFFAVSQATDIWKPLWRWLALVACLCSYGLMFHTISISETAAVLESTSAWRELELSANSLVTIS